MTYLLDTHTLLWAFFEDEKLSAKAKEAISDATNEIYVSVISYWEISLKFAMGRLELQGITPDELPEKAREIDIDTLDLLEDDAITFYQLPRLKHKDPFDRLIIWQAIRRDIPLISKDKHMEDYQQFGLETLWN